MVTYAKMRVKAGLAFFVKHIGNSLPMEDEKPIAVDAAILSNMAIAIAKYSVAFITGSSAMLAEDIHSTADTGNELWLLVGLRKSSKPADETHPFGHGRELYF